MGAKKILVVEDEILVARDMQGRLEQAGYIVVGMALSGEEAIQKARDLRPDVILMDIHLQGKIDGIEAAIQIRTFLDIPILYLTAYNDPETLDRLNTTEPAVFFLKPFEGKELIINLDIMLRKHENEKKLKEEREESEQKRILAQEANRIKSEFIANMSHELRTPINGIMGFAQLMQSGAAGPISAEQKLYVSNILSSSQHLLQLINGVLDLAKIESGKIEFYPERIDITKVTQEACDNLQTLIAKNKINLQINIDQKLTDLILDPAKFKQLLYNYLSNAIKFTAAGGNIDISITVEDADHFRLSVNDTGIGISEKDLAKLFIEYQQLDSGITKKYQGTGIGLALTKRLVEAQGGVVGVRSELGIGSTFYAILPKIHIKNSEKLTE